MIFFRTFTILLIGLFTSSCQADNNACQEFEYQVYYIPLERNFVIPPTREDLLRRKSKILKSLNITCLLKELKTSNISSELTIRDSSSFRILIKTIDGTEEIMILKQKSIVYKNRVYPASTFEVSPIIEEIKHLFN